MSNSPIFIFSAGWRSGSTLLQRLISSSGKVLIWGEAGGALDCFSDSFDRYGQMLGDGNQRFKHGFGGNGAKEFSRFIEAGDKRNHHWSACMNPPAEHIASTYKNFLDHLYGQPAFDLGYSSWGVKEVRSGIETAYFLKNIYPDAKFIFLVRNPFDVILSIKKRNWMDYVDHPAPLLFYLKHWKKLANEFRTATLGLPIKYEDLVNDPTTINKLSDYLQLSDIPHDFIQESHADWESNTQVELSLIEKTVLSYMLKTELKTYHYQCPSK
ncbi:sulfotransferase [Methylomarinum sp. Ch1-1]|uniref:Sulfotransferase n=1 Tax=Methylomarinum roseum TaxID=3067653 RepID=A0AAU7NPK4_9GAMM|nr:sulfotransferase [Methylomarinum sp. Ch1-1]MDP4521199.1 sulfotransferase [Methylomarinum sp. Ch1-1]